jgi:hypothetical protein
MSSERDGQGRVARLPALPRRPVEEELEELLFTLEICRRALAWDAHPAHYERLRRIEGMVRWSLEQR